MRARFESMAKVEQTKVTVLTTGGTTMIWLCAAVCLAVLSSTAPVLVEGAPILGPDLDSCVPYIPDEKTAADAESCCFIDTGKPIKAFKFDPNLPMRVRRPMHKLDEEFVRKYERGYELMRALPPDDPRSFTMQSNLHCIYCAGGYSQFNSSETIDIHRNWFSMPFHRWYMYFHERIIARLLGDDTFALPYWAWDVQNVTSPILANAIPGIFLNENSSLYDSMRSDLHRPPHVADLEVQMEPHNKDPEVLKRNNLYNMWRVMIGDAKTPETFFGGKYSQGDKHEDKSGRLEFGPHAGIHTWVGSDTYPGRADLGPAYSAGRDPIFFAHHSQVDRLWLMWKRFGGQDFADPDWLDAEFLFYDEYGDMVRVKIRDCLDIAKLKVSFEETPADWLDYTPRSIRDMDPKYFRSGTLKRLWRQLVAGDALGSIAVTLRNFFQLKEGKTDVVLRGEKAMVTSRISRPEVRSQRTMVEKTSDINYVLPLYDEVLVVSGVVAKPFDIRVAYKLFMELPEANQSTPLDCVEYLGSFYFESEGLHDLQESTVYKKFTQKIGIGDRLSILHVSRKRLVTLTFVPAWDTKHDSDVSIRFTELRIELQLVRR